MARKKRKSRGKGKHRDAGSAKEAREKLKSNGRR